MLVANKTLPMSAISGNGTITLRWRFLGDTIQFPSVPRILRAVFKGEAIHVRGQRRGKFPEHAR